MSVTHRLEISLSSAGIIPAVSMRINRLHFALSSISSSLTPTTSISTFSGHPSLVFHFPHSPPPSLSHLLHPCPVKAFHQRRLSINFPLIYIIVSQPLSCSTSSRSIPDFKLAKKKSLYHYSSAWLFLSKMADVCGFLQYFISSDEPLYTSTSKSCLH